MSAPYVHAWISKYPSPSSFSLWIVVAMMTGGFFERRMDLGWVKTKVFVLSTGSCTSWKLENPSLMKEYLLTTSWFAITHQLDRIVQLWCDERDSFDGCNSQWAFSTSSRVVTVKGRLLSEHFPLTLRLYNGHTYNGWGSIHGQYTSFTPWDRLADEILLFWLAARYFCPTIVLLLRSFLGSYNRRFISGSVPERLH